MADPIPNFACLIAIYRHYAPSPDRWCYTKNIQQGYGWGVGDLAFYAYDQQEPETIPIYQHQAWGGPDRYIYDDNPNDHDGWINTTPWFYAYKRDNPRRDNTTVPIYQHREPPSAVDRYYYDTYPDPSGSIVFYAYPRPRNLLDEISGVIGLRDSMYSGVTYEVTEDNTFTLLDTPQLWDSKSSTAPETIPACENLLDEITTTISQGSDIVDIALMWETDAGLPKGKFQQALNRGFLQLIQSGRRPLVRIMIGIPAGPWVLRGNLMTWVQKTVELYPKVKLRQVEYRILIGACKQGPNSWNHSKIVAADGVRAVVGGHNLWSNHYIGATPVHDVSGLIEGPAVAAAHQFCDQLWTNPAYAPGVCLWTNGGWINSPTKDKLSYKRIGKQGKGTTRMLALGRLGSGIANQPTVATNASVSARLIAMCRAEKNIRISQQSLYFRIAGGVPGFDFYTLWAIIKAVQAGVNVQIVITNDVPLKEGGSYLPQVLDSLAALQIADRLGLLLTRDNPNSGNFYLVVSPKREDIVAWVSASLNPLPSGMLPLVVSKVPKPDDCVPLLKELNTNLQLAQLYYAPKFNYWTVGAEKKLAANHAKVYIIDDTHFYVGSDNMYLSGSVPGLQEYGYLIEGKTETQQFISQYWEKLWNNSGKSPFTMKFPPARPNQGGPFRVPGPQ